MIYIAALLLAPWLRRVTRAASLEDRVRRLEVGFWFVVTLATLAILTAALLQRLPDPARPAAPPGQAPGRA